MLGKKVNRLDSAGNHIARHLKLRHSLKHREECVFVKFMESVGCGIAEEDV